MPHIQPLLPPIGWLASTCWKPSFQTLEATFPPIGSKAPNLFLPPGKKSYDYSSFESSSSAVS